MYENAHIDKILYLCWLIATQIGYGRELVNS
jgi:hypothetical protein